ncbi:MAG: helix-turn-helix transcriptional regulator [Rhodobacteraceae bacterium]|nr:helix-turn-helix transcriptional regulator [Paracoccaceae bacterium]
MAKEVINPEILKSLRRQANLSQTKLAEVARVGKATIARIEGGKGSANTTTVTRLADALGVSPTDMADGPARTADSFDRERECRRLGYRRLKTIVRETTALSFRMVEKRYGISWQQQIELAPLFSALLAEGSLAWRKEQMEQAEKAAKVLEDADYGHCMFMKGTMRAEAGVAAEQESIEQFDIFGKITLEDSDRDPCLPWTDPFSRYLQHLVERSGSQSIKVLPHDDESKIDGWNWTTAVHLKDHAGLEYSIDAAELERLTGGDRWAMMALTRSHVKLDDIPDKLMGEDAAADRIAWLGRQVPQSEVEEAEAEDMRWKELLLNFGPNVPVADAGDHPAAEEHSNG